MIAVARKVAAALRSGPMPCHQCIALAAALAALPAILLFIAEVLS